MCECVIPISLQVFPLFLFFSVCVCKDVCVRVSILHIDELSRIMIYPRFFFFLLISRSQMIVFSSGCLFHLLFLLQND